MFPPCAGSAAGNCPTESAKIQADRDKVEANTQKLVGDRAGIKADLAQLAKRQDRRTENQGRRGLSHALGELRRCRREEN